MKACPFCAEEIQDAAIVCKHCGRDLQPATTPTAAPAAAVPPAAAAAKPSAARTGCLGCLGITGALITMGVIASFLGDGSTTPRPDHTTGDAWVICQNFVTDRLRSPATAKFPWATDSKVSISHKGGGEYDVVGYVDSQNGFGAMIRSPFLCSVAWQSGTNYRLTNLKIGN